MNDDNMEMRISKLAESLKTPPHGLRVAMLLWLEGQDVLNQEGRKVLDAVRLVHEIG